MTTLLIKKLVMINELKELWRFRYLLQMLVGRELKVRYKNSVLGFFWSIVPPLLQVLVLTLFVRNAFAVKAENYPAILLCGILPWTFFSNAALDASQSLLHNYGIIKKIYMPREIIPLAIVISNFFHFVLSWLIFFVTFLLVYPLIHKIGIPLLPSMLWFPLLLILVLILTTGASLWAAALNIFYEDVKFILTTLFGLAYFVIPILFTADVVRYSETMKENPLFFKLYMLNPITSIITAFRAILLQPIQPGWINAKMKGSEYPPISMDWSLFAISTLISIVFAWSGYYYFNSRKWKFVERG